MVMMVKDPQVMELVEEVVEQDLVDLMLLNQILVQQQPLVVRVLLFLG